jgi:hypothetical protein
MAYITKNHVVFEHYGKYDETRKKLRELGFTFTEQNFYNDFRGIRFLINKPTGKGSQNKITILLNLDR